MSSNRLNSDTCQYRQVLAERLNQVNNKLIVPLLCEPCYESQSVSVLNIWC